MLVGAGADGVGVYVLVDAEFLVCTDFSVLHGVDGVRGGRDEIKLVGQRHHKGIPRRRNQPEAGVTAVQRRVSEGERLADNEISSSDTKAVQCRITA